MIALIDPHTGSLTVEGLTPAQLREVSDLLGPVADVNCGRPRGYTVPTPTVIPAVPVRIARIYHGSVVDGPGRRSVLQMQGCPIRCKGCYVPETHDMSAGVLMDAHEAVLVVLDPVGAPRDGVTILGGEPFAQPAALLEIVTILRQLDQHIVLYTGYTVESLCKRLAPEFAAVLDVVDIVIDGPYVQALSPDAGEWRGSRNQRVLEVA